MLPQKNTDATKTSVWASKNVPSLWKYTQSKFGRPCSLAPSYLPLKTWLCLLLAFVHSVLIAICPPGLLCLFPAIVNPLLIFIYQPGLFFLFTGLAHPLLIFICPPSLRRLFPCFVYPLLSFICRLSPLPAFVQPFLIFVCSPGLASCFNLCASDPCPPAQSAS